jgi:hypothetical protein
MTNQSLVAPPIATGWAEQSYTTHKTEIPELPYAAQLHRHVAPILHTDLCQTALDYLFNDLTLHAIPVVDSANAPYALIERHSAGCSPQFTSLISPKKVGSSSIWGIGLSAKPVGSK